MAILTSIDRSTLLVVVGCCILSFVFISRLVTPTIIKRNGVRLRYPPDTLPILGNGLVFLQPRASLFAWFVRTQRYFGHETFQLAVPTLPPGIVIHDPASLEYVFRYPEIFEKDGFFRARASDLFGDGIVNASGSSWRVQRRAGLKFLSAVNLGIISTVALPRYLRETFAEIEIGQEDCKSNGDTTIPLDLQHLFLDITSRIMGRMAFNMHMRASDDFTQAFELASNVVADRFQNPFWRLKELVTGASFRRALVVVKTTSHKIVQNAMALRKRAPEVLHNHSDEDEKSLSDSTHGSVCKDSHPSESQDNKTQISNQVLGSLINSLLDSIADPTLVADSALNYLTAGRDTVAQTLTWAVYLLLQHPESIQSIRHEAKAVQAEAIATNKQVPDSGTACYSPARMPYTMAVLYETLRLYPPIPIEIKQATRSTCLPDGTLLPSGCMVVWCPWSMNRSELTWGHDATAFRPERWLALDNDCKQNKKASSALGQRFLGAGRSQAEFPVFNGGPRLCVGKPMAETIMVQILAALLMRYHVSFDLAAIAIPLAEGMNGVDNLSAAVPTRTCGNTLTLPMQGGLPCLLTRRKKVN